MFRLAYIEALKDIKSSLRGIRLIILLFEIFIFTMLFAGTIDDFGIVHVYILIAITLSVAFALRPKMCKILFIIPIDNNSGYKYIKYKGHIVFCVNILLYIALTGFVSWLFEFEYIQLIKLMLIRYLPVLFFCCIYAIAITNRAVERLSKTDWLLGTLIILPMINLEFGIMGMIGMIKNNKIGLIIVLLSYISAIIAYIMVVKRIKVSFNIIDHEIYENYSKLKSIFSDFTKREYESYYEKKNRHRR